MDEIQQFHIGQKVKFKTRYGEYSPIYVIEGVYENDIYEISNCNFEKLVFSCQIQDKYIELVNNGKITDKTIKD